MAKFEVYEKRLGRERIVKTTRREQGAINERDIAIDSAYRNAKMHVSRSGGRALQGPNGKRNEVDVVYYDETTTAVWTYGYRRLGPDPEVEAANAALEDALLASLMVRNGTTL